MRPSREQITRSLFENMSALKRGMHGHLLALNRDSPISRSQLELLFAIQHTQPVNSKQLATQLQMTPGAISQLAESIEQHGYIERRTSESDRRIQFLHVSAKGETLIRGFEKQRRQMMEAVIADLSDEELEVWLRVQTKMVEYFKPETAQINQEEK